jgi:hypothetical protein
MEPVIKPVDRELILSELTPDKYIRNTRKCGNELYEVTAQDSPFTMREIGRLRELAFRMAGGGTGKEIDIDEYDTDPEAPYRQLIVWDPEAQEIIGGYRYILCKDLDPEKLATKELFKFSEKFTEEYLPYTIELGRSFIQPAYQGTRGRRKGIFALDNVWDGLGALMTKYDDYKYFFGKVTMYATYNYTARNTLLFFLNKYFVDSEQLVSPIEPLDYDGKNPSYEALFSNLQYQDAYKVLHKELKSKGENIPPLINSYMNLSPTMKVFGTSINKGFGGVEETGILVKIEDMYFDKIERHIAPLKQFLSSIAFRFRPKWWRRSL